MDDRNASMDDRPTTIGALRETGYRPRTVKTELRANLVQAIGERKQVFPGIVGYDATVLPQIENAILSGQDIILLGERGQAKTRIARQLIGLLDRAVPAIAGCEINDEPFAPICAACRYRVANDGDAVELVWLTPDQRYSEKLATPDISIADLIGEVDPIKVAEGRYLSDELTIHYGLLPRTHRGIFTLNELPDLAERVQVGLLNVMEERDVQIRGYKVRLPLDIVLVASANPEDYTNRGRIITPLKDRFGAQIRTHYPVDTETETAVMHQEAVVPELEGLRVELPAFMAEIVAALSQLARESPHINQRSGVSVRLSITNKETLLANAARRALRQGEREVVPRISDLEALVASTAGKVEIESVDDGRDDQVLNRLLMGAVLEVFRRRVRSDRLVELLTAFEDGLEVDAGDDVPSQRYVELLRSLPGLREILSGLEVGETPGGIASAAEFTLEGLHLSKRLNKDAVRGRATYRARR